MDPPCPASAVHPGRGVIVLGVISWHILDPFVPTLCLLNTTAYPNIVADHIYLFMITVYLSSDGHFQQDNAPCEKSLISNWCLDLDSESIVLKWPPQSLDLSPIEHSRDVV